MTWRRFTNLLAGLSGESLFVQITAQREKEKPIEDHDSILMDMMGKLSRK